MAASTCCERSCSATNPPHPSDRVPIQSRKHRMSSSNSEKTNTLDGVKNVVLVHGAWADGSGWAGVHRALTDRGYNVSIVQNPLTSLAADVAAVDRVLARQHGKALLVGHSYGGAVITEAGSADSVAALVYVAAFVPDAGESISTLLGDGQEPPVKPSADGFLFFDPTIFPQAFAQDVGAEGCLPRGRPSSTGGGGICHARDARRMAREADLLRAR
ncbi:esterase/lipase family protein [Nannocystis pusilla]|uniref:esterase/lipase family protein n=1 Tax=Nannocystis pusilla TaxID=889268 RepID=UPI003B8134B2